MYKGTTPTYIFTLPEDIDLSSAESVYVTFAKSNYEVILTKQDDELEVDANTVSVYLTQDETLEFPRSEVLIQINWTFKEDGETKRACSEIVHDRTHRNLINEVI